MITSGQNPRLKGVAKLRERRTRKQQGQMIIDGGRCLSRALNAGVAVESVYLPAGAELSEEEQAAVELSSAANVDIVEVANNVFSKIAYGDRDLGLVAVAKSPTYELAELELPSEPLLLVVESIEKPGNLGAMLRTANAAGCDAVLVADPRTDLTNPNVIRASMGALFSTRVAQAASEQVLAWLQAGDYRILAARVDGAAKYTTVDYQGSVALVLGSEAEGLSRVWHGERVQPIYVPMRGTVDSLNVSVTAAVLLYEAQRQRNI